MKNCTSPLGTVCKDPVCPVHHAQDSRPGTIAHSRRVDELLLEVVTAVQKRVTRHDLSKLQEPEVSAFDEMATLLSRTEYGSPEYKEQLAQMKPALEHHYAENRHHPEHFENGVNGMTLVDVIEMLVDWKAATERNLNGDLAKSLVIQQERFGLSEQLVEILENTAREFGWIN